MNTHNARLTPNEVQNIRDLCRYFRVTTIARAYGVCGRTANDIKHGHAWRHVPDVPAPLPPLALHAAAMLRLRTFKKLTPEQRQIIEQYARQIVAPVESEAEREALALELVAMWKPNKPTPRREVRCVSVAQT